MAELGFSRASGVTATSSLNAFVAPGHLIGVAIEAAVGQTAAIQAGNQLQGEIVTTLIGIQSAPLTAYHLDALEATNRATQH